MLPAVPSAPIQAMQAMNIKAQRIVPIIESTKPAVAIPHGFFFLAITPSTIPTIPMINPNHCKKKLNTIATIPRTKEAIANPLDFFSSIIHPPYFDII